MKLLTKREKAWFFPLCGEQPKINELIFLFLKICGLVFSLSSERCQPSERALWPVVVSVFLSRLYPCF
ncbi:hypothetical protein F3J28_11215 [Enterobacter sp. Ap-1006]|nr:hypothetical protein [Enterobacter sp. Ap-1006]